MTLYYRWPNMFLRKAIYRVDWHVVTGIKERCFRHFLNNRLWNNADASAIIAFGLLASSVAAVINTELTNTGSLSSG